jgi:hypothetical protein
MAKNRDSFCKSAAPILAPPAPLASDTADRPALIVV